MATDSHIHRGIVHGRMIELVDDTGLPDGQEVAVVLSPVTNGLTDAPIGEGLRRAFGAWAEDSAELDDFLREIRRNRRRRGTES